MIPDRSMSCPVPCDCPTCVAGQTKGLSLSFLLGVLAGVAGYYLVTLILESAPGAML